MAERPSALVVGRGPASFMTLERMERGFHGRKEFGSGLEDGWTGGEEVGARPDYEQGSPFSLLAKVPGNVAPTD